MALPTCLRKIKSTITKDTQRLFQARQHTVHANYTEAFLRQHPGGKSFVFEPSEKHFEQLRGRLGASTNVILIRAGLGAASGEARLYKDEDITGLASLTRRRLDHLGIKMEKEEVVHLQTVDEAVSQHGVTHIDLLKIDVEGHELDVLKGASKSFEECRVGLVQFEFGGCNLDTRTSLQDFFYFFREHGFEIRIIQPSGRLQLLGEYDEIFEQYRTTNFLAVPVGSKIR